MVTKMNKDLQYYLSLPYSVEITQIPEDEGGGYTACIPELGRWSVVGDGDDPNEAFNNLRAAMAEVIEEWLDKGQRIPEPRNAANELPSGHLTLRIPRSLHAQVNELAREEGTSINQYLLNIIAQAAAKSSREINQTG